MRKLLIAGVLLAALLPNHAGAAPKGGTVSHGSYTQPGGLTRGYLLYTPAGLKPNRPLVSFLHGCNQTAGQAMIATRFNALADKEKFAVLYPEQVVASNSSAPIVDGNGVGCWNWFLPEHQKRDAGEPGVLAGMVQAVAKKLKSDRKRIYVEGISAGGAMTVNLAATYPDVFAAAASLAACSYQTCADGSGSLTHDAMGTRARIVPLFVENGTADSLNPVAQSQNLVDSWLGADDLADDGEMNLSISREPATDTTSTPSGTPNPGSGDPCVHNNTFLCPGGILGLSDYPVTIRTWNDAKGRDILEFYIVHGMAHAQPHAPAGEPYTDPQGPDVTTASYRFFLKHRLP